LREREQSNTTMKVQEENQERNLQLLKRFEDVDKKIDLLQGTIQRYFMLHFDMSCILNLRICRC
jgi:hypothetical protein